MTPYANVVLRQHEIEELVFNGGESRDKVVVFVKGIDFPDPDLAVLMSGEDFGFVECNGLDEPGGGIVVKRIDKGVVG